MKVSIKRNGFYILQIFTLILLFLAGLNIGNKYFYFCFIATAMFIVMKKTVTFDFQFIALLILSFSWLLFSPDTQTLAVTSIVKPFLYPMAYIAGRSFFMGKSQSDFQNKQKLIVPIVVVLSTGPFVHYFLNYINNFSSLNRNTVDIWTGTVLSATNQAALGCMMLGVSLALLFSESKKYVKALSIASLIIIFLYNLVLSGRTLFVMAAFVLLACIIYYLVSVKSVSKKIKIISIVVIISILLYLAYVYNAFEIKDYVEKSNIYLRFLNKTSEQIFSSVRNQFKLRYLENFWAGIFGGGHIKDIVGRYAHDLFLDSYDEAGIFALLAIVYFIVRSVYVLIKCLANKQIDFQTRLIMLTLYISLYSEFLIEPILQGVPWLFALFCFIHGVIENLYSHSLKRENIHA